MDNIISICGWTAFAAIATLLAIFTLALAWGAFRLGIHISTRLIKERRAWKKAIKNGNLEMIRGAAFIMRDRLEYGGKATLDDIIRDTYIRQAE